MIEELDIIKHTENVVDRDGYTANVVYGGAINKINEIIEIVNALVEKNNIHEEQIDKLQMRNEELAERINYTLARATDDKEVLKRLDEKYKPADPIVYQGE